MLEVSAPIQRRRKFRWVRATAMRFPASLIRLRKELRFYAIIRRMKNIHLRRGSGGHVDQTRRRFMATFAATSLGTTLMPGVLWARMQDAGASKVTLAMVTEALKTSGVDLPEEEKNNI